MAWKPKPMSWEVFQDFCLPTDTVTVYQRLMEQKHVVKHVVSLADGRMLIVSMKGTPIQPEPKKKKVESEEPHGPETPA